MTMAQISHADARIFFYSAPMAIFEKLHFETSLDFGEYCGICREGMAEEWMDEDKMEAVSFEILDNELKSPGYLDNLIAAFEMKSGLYKDYIGLLERTDLTRLSDQELIGMYWTFLDLYIAEFSLPALTLIYKEHLSDALYGKLEPRLGDGTALVLSCVTTSGRESFSFEQRKDMLGIMSRIYDSNGSRLFMEMAPGEAEAALKDEMPELYEELLLHARRYYWINNNYRRAIVLGPLDFIVKMQDEALSFSHPKEELALMEETRRETLEKKGRYLDDLTEEERAMAYLLAEGSWWQDERKRNNLMANHFLMQFLEEVSRRAAVEQDALLNATIYELPAVLNGKMDADALADRGKHHFSMHTNYSLKGRTLSFGIGRRYRLKEVERTSHLRGTPASHGKVEGEVIVITREEEFSKMKSGAILVSVMTRPEYTPLMKKAAGIITDEGGLTCHAAVVSREFKIPCLVGTRHATRILKDGDRVELDATKGIVTLRS